MVILHSKHVLWNLQFNNSCLVKELKKKNLKKIDHFKSFFINTFWTNDFSFFIKQGKMSHVVLIGASCHFNQLAILFSSSFFSLSLYLKAMMAKQSYTLLAVASFGASTFLYFFHSVPLISSHLHVSQSFHYKISSGNSIQQEDDVGQHSDSADTNDYWTP